MLHHCCKTHLDISEFYCNLQHLWIGWLRLLQLHCHPSGQAPFVLFIFLILILLSSSIFFYYYLLVWVKYLSICFYFKSTHIFVLHMSTTSLRPAYQDPSISIPRCLPHFNSIPTSHHGSIVHLLRADGGIMVFSGWEKIKSD